MQAAELPRDREREPLETSLLLRWQDVVIRNARAAFCSYGWRPLAPAQQPVEPTEDAGDCVEAVLSDPLEHDPGAYGPGAVDARDLAQNWQLLVLTDPAVRQAAEEHGDAYVARWAQWRAKDAMRDARRNRSLEQVYSEPEDRDEQRNVIHLDRFAARRLQGALSVEAATERAAEALYAAEKTHSRINDEFTAKVRHRLANSQDRALREGCRPLVIEVLLQRRSLLATLLYDGPRDKYPGAAAEGKRLVEQSGNSIGRVRNLRTELIALLREALDDEIRIALAKLAELWGVTRSQAAQLHLRWAEQGDASCVYEQGTARATLDAPATGGARRRLVSKGTRSRSHQGRPNRRLRLSILARDGFRCVYCGTSYRPTIDHRIPRSRGGRAVPDNLVTACWDCNKRKGNRIWPVPAKRGTGASRGR